MAGKKAWIILDLITTGAQKKLRSMDTAWQKQKKSILSVKNAIGAVFMGAAIRKVISIGSDLIASAKQQADAESHLEAAMRSRGVYTREALDDLKAYASQMQRVTTIGDEMSIRVMAQLQAFGLTNEEIKRATRIAADFNARGKDMVSIAELIGRAKTGEIGMLTRYGVQLTDAEKKAKDFNVVLERMESLHKGAATALAQTPVGKLQQMANAWGDIKETLGFGIADAIAQVTKNIGLSADELGRFNDEAGELAAIKISSALQDWAAGFQTLYGGLKYAAGGAVLGAGAALPVGVAGQDIRETGRALMASGRGSIEYARKNIADIDAREAMAREELESRRRAARRRREAKNKASIGTVR